MTQTAAPAAGDAREIKRVQSFVPGLDAVLGGGFLQGGLYMVQGPPGMGKTILASQMLYSRGTEGGHALYITVLGENHGRMMAHMRPLQFFNEALVPDHITYLSGFKALEEDGLKGLFTLISREVLKQKAAFLVLDGMSAVEGQTGDDFQIKRFTHELQTLASGTDCTMFLLTSVVGAMSSPEHTMVDGLIELRQRASGSRTERRLVVHKLRGTGFLEGEHAFRITRGGLTVFPRIEALLATPTRRAPTPRTRITSGVPTLDVMFNGGLPEATMTGIVGPSGAGKTAVGLHFLSCSTAAEPGLLFGCYEPPERLRLKADTVGLDLAAVEQRGDLEILWYPLGEHVLDELAERLLEAVRRRGVKRLLVDGISGFQHATLEPERIVRFWSTLSNELRALGVTTLYTMELQDSVRPELLVPAEDIATLSEVMLLVRYVELRSRLYRLISLSKVREGNFDPTIREFTISDAGLAVGKPFEGVEAVLSGIAREVARGAAPPISGGLALATDRTGRSE